jgi:hypothetical protein
MPQTKLALQAPQLHHRLHPQDHNTWVLLRHKTANDSMHWNEQLLLIQTSTKLGPQHSLAFTTGAQPISHS